MRLCPKSLPADCLNTPSPTPDQTEPARIEILEAFADMPDVRNASGKRHHLALCLALFTLAIAAGNRGFGAIGDWIICYQSELLELFNPIHFSW